jgi:hypothetical protein
MKNKLSKLPLDSSLEWYQSSLCVPAASGMLRCAFEDTLPCPGALPHSLGCWLCTHSREHGRNAGSRTMRRREGTAMAWLATNWAPGHQGTTVSLENDAQLNEDIQSAKEGAT